MTSRRSAGWIALAVGIATVVALVLADRLRRRTAVGTGWAPDPGPQSVVSAGPSTGDLKADATASPALAVSDVQPEVRAAPAEQPLATWIRLTIVGVALLAFLAISLIATKTV